MLLTAHDPDIICVSETHLKGNEAVTLPNYVFFGLNRKLKSSKGLGGVGILIKRTLMDKYHANRCYKLYDNVLGVELICNTSGENNNYL